MKTVALIEIGNGGHHNAYMRLFTAALLELDCRVICLIPDTAPISDWVQQTFPDKADRVIFQPFEFYRGRFRLLGRLRERLNILYDWYNIHRVVRDIDRQHGLHTDLIFLSFLDLYLLNRVPPALLDRLMPAKWSGLYFFPALVSQQPELLNAPPKFAHRDIIFTAKNCIGIGLLNNSLCDRYSQRLGKPVLRFPDIVDATPPNPKSPIAREIRERAKGRTVVGTIGLERHKCGFEFLQLAMHADPNTFFFAFTGPFYDHFLDYYTPDEVAQINAFRQNLPENCYWNTERIPDMNGDAEYNAVINAFDIVWVVYRNFYGSSNRLTKATIFQKLVISSNEACIGEIVSSFDLGETLPDMQVSTLLNTLNKLQSRLEHRALPYANWKNYIQMQSPEMLRICFRDLLSRT